jgi:hypothetical protein
MRQRTCRVTFRDINCIEHSVEVLASSLFQAVAAGLVAMRQTTWFDISQGYVEAVVEVQEAATATHRVEIRRFYEWVEQRGIGKSPKEASDRDAVKKILGG